MFSCEYKSIQLIKLHFSLKPSHYCPETTTALWEQTHTCYAHLSAQRLRPWATLSVSVCVQQDTHTHRCVVNCCGNSEPSRTLCWFEVFDDSMEAKIKVDKAPCCWQLITLISLTLKRVRSPKPIRMDNVPPTWQLSHDDPVNLLKN